MDSPPTPASWGPAAEATAAAAARRSPDPLLVLALDGAIRFANEAAHALFGAPTALAGMPAWPFVHPDDVAGVRAELAAAAREPGSRRRCDLRVLDAHGHWRRLRGVFVAAQADPALGGLVASLREDAGHPEVLQGLGELAGASEQLGRLALHDLTTGLPNRTLLLDRLEQALRHAEGAETVGVVCLDLDGFGQVNARLGSAAGDLLLRAVGERLLRAADQLSPATARDVTVARIGADEFAVLLQRTDEAGLLAAAQALRAAVSAEPFGEAGGTSLTVSTGVAAGSSTGVAAGSSTGVATGSAGGSAEGPGGGAGVAHGAGSLLSEAVGAMNRAKLDSPGQALLAQAGAGELAAAGEALRAALAAGQVSVHYQPVLDLRSGQVEELEALVRWQHPERGLLLPADFLPAAEASGAVRELGRHVLTVATRDAAALSLALGRPLAVSVNLSARQLAEPDLVEFVVATLAACDLAPGSLVVELTETAVIDDAAAAEPVLKALSRLGVRLAIDDFGTGYASLTYLKRFPVDTLKIDRSFVAGLGSDAGDSAIVVGLLSLAHAAGLTTLAEGVETPDQLAALRRLGCQRAQGYLWSPALPFPEARRLLQERRDGWPWVPSAGAAGAGPAPAGEGLGLLSELGLQVDPDLEPALARMLALHLAGASPATIAAALNAQGYRTARGIRWHPRTVTSTLARLTPPPARRGRRPATGAGQAAGAGGLPRRPQR